MESTPYVSAHWLSAFVLLCSFFSTHTLDTKIHEHMTPEELQSVFHVDHHTLVPPYHLVQLTHHLARRHVAPGHQTNIITPANAKTPHEKPSKKQWKTETSPPSLLNDEMFVKAKENIKDVDIIGDLNNTVSVNFDVTNSSEISDSASVLSDLERLVEGQEVDVHKIDLEAFGRQLKLVLKKQEGLLKKDGLRMWKAHQNESQPHGVDYEELVSEDEEDLGDLYQDEENGAALLIRRHPKHGKLVVEGSIGHDLVIRPIPDSMTAAAQDDEMFMDPSSMADMVSIDTGLPLVKRKREDQARLTQALNGAQHVIIKRDPADAEHDHLGDYAFMEPDHLGKRFRRKRSAEPHSRRKREAPYVIYPEILVIVDYDGYRLHGGDNVQIKRYFVSFWNGVDLRYKLLKGPRIRISIAGIIISRGRDATPYLERNRVGRDAIDSAAALTDMGKYLFRERRLPVYDIAVAITKLDMCRRQFPNDACNRGTAGFAYVGGACVVNKRLEKVNSVAIIEDTGGFSGIIVAAHEVGHLLGAVHDGSPPPSYLGGPGAEKCRWEDGYIMSDLRHTEKGFRWSPCSVQSFHHFLNGDTATCLYNSPHEDDSLPRVLPGRLLTLDAQCRKDRGTSACFKDERVCAQLFCFDAASGYCVAYRPAAEGSPCGDGQYCINGRCITEHENIIPDYSQHTPSYVRPETSPFFGNITSYDGTTQPYVVSTSAPPAQTTKYYQKSTEYTTTTKKPYFQFTTRNPYQFFTEKSTTTTQPPSVTYPPSINKYSITSTKSPYDFKDFTTRPTTTTTAKRGFYNKEDFDGFFRRSTTKSPYQDKSVKPVFKIGTYYSQAKSSDNSIRPDANSQQVQIEPARLLFSYQRNLTSGTLVQP
ncbi:A disintegrin and metalloproteinase with thrombospondin motifs 1 isoform X1 [Helicoverpa zea]|uniref:A disintegrin and metalloproteinase with thrombospondin motifs 1 isoform X1 n=1 Tax=Helicoverpa zea TaxID=7113 RepID=UPI001F5905D0|nr:A disintegrin and metalloproteinase with thrombospondin motifs 1 isoform X1 [Helicoverpa zea]XP_047035374.1 A disintegrin and metalloproteinase with thrombospondin motifs 1 isoform X1 [Helicoverpa zea]XP_047035375.1 A disintegrin and metalloproteinase with thrombospondin motifs 1 isoform X1 [Helicoverpa zea]